MIRRRLGKLVKKALGRHPAAKPGPSTPTPDQMGVNPEWKEGPSQKGETVPPEPPDLEVEAQQVKAWHNDGKALLFVDVREREEIEAGHAPGAWLMPMGLVESQGRQLPRDRAVIVYCAAGGRSYGAAQFLRDQGYEDAWSLIGGFGAWVAEFEESARPPPDAPLRVLTPVLLKTQAAAERGLEGADKGLPGSIQALRTRGDGWIYDLRVSDRDGVVHLVENVDDNAFQTIGRVPRRPVRAARPADDADQ